MAKLNHEKLAINILTTSSIRDAAGKSGVSEATVYRLRKEPEFQAVLNEVKNSIFQDTMQKAQGYCLESLEVLRTIMKDTTATDSSRVSAARTVLELGFSSAEQETILRKLEDLERRLLDE